SADGIADGTADDPCHVDPSFPNAGHGTAVATVLAGNTLGAAKGVTVVPVRVIGCSGQNFSTADIVGGINKIVGTGNQYWDHTNMLSTSPAVANFSFGFLASLTDTEPNSVENAIETLMAGGVVVFVSANNQGAADGAASRSPSRLAYSDSLLLFT